MAVLAAAAAAVAGQEISRKHMQGGRALGYGLIAAGGGVLVLMAAWLLVAGVNPGGFVLGLLLTLVIAGPLAGGGWYVLSRQPAEALAAATFESKRRILDQDRLFRRELAAELRQLARRPALPEARITELAEDLERKAYDSAEWYDVVQLDDTDTGALRRYDDLVWEQVRDLRRRADGATPEAPEVDRATRALEDALDQRRDLLLRGKRAAAVAPGALLRAGPPQRGTEGLEQVGPGDALTYEDVDHVVEGVASYFAEGRTWKLARLVPSGANVQPRWLYVGPGALVSALLEEVRLPAAGASQLELDGTTLNLESSGSATADIAAPGGNARGLLVSYWVYRGGDRLALFERWPDGSAPAYAGNVVSPLDLELWPAAVPPAG